MNIMARMVSAVGVLVITSLFLPSFLSATTGSRNLTFGIYGGRSLGKLGPIWWGRWHEEFDFDLSLGTYVQYNFSAMFSVQANVNYQHGRRDWSFLTYNVGESVVTEGTESFRFGSVNLNAVLNDRGWRASVFYLLAGCGITLGNWDEFSGTYFNLTAGVGVKTSLSSSHPKLALNIGVTYVYLIDPQEYSSHTADYFRFQIGIEF